MHTRSIGFALGLAALAACGTQQKNVMTTFHMGSWEKDIGYSQSVKMGNRILVSGTTGDESVSKDLASQMKDVYKAIQATLAHDGATMGNIVKETIYCRDMDALIAAQELRKSFYGSHLPAATWVQVQRLYSPGHLIEIEVEAVLP